MADLSLPSQELLLQLLRYDADTGKLFWLPRPLESFAVASKGKIWNTRFAGKEAYSLSVRGYVIIAINGQRHYAHRIIWRMVTGEIPAEVDHINGDRVDNRFINLRSATREMNGRNLSIKSNNTSGVNGVYWHKKDQRWVAYGKLDHKMVVIGRFKEKQEASDARQLWNASNGFHENHGQR
jgi:hypothetical protein